MSREKTATVDVTTEIVIGQTVGIVAAYAADPSNAPACYQNITSVTWETRPPLHAGSKLTFSACFLGRQLAYTYEITDFVPAERLVMRTAQGPGSPGSRPPDSHRHQARQPQGPPASSAPSSRPGDTPPRRRASPAQQTAVSDLADETTV